MWTWAGLNRRPSAYEAAALDQLSYKSKSPTAVGHAIRLKTQTNLNKQK